MKMAPTGSENGNIKRYDPFRAGMVLLYEVCHLREQGDIELLKAQVRPSVTLFLLPTNSV